MLEESCRQWNVTTFRLFGIIIIELDDTDQEVQEIEKTQNEYRDGQLEHVQSQRGSSTGNLSTCSHNVEAAQPDLTDMGQERHSCAQYKSETTKSTVMTSCTTRERGKQQRP